MWSKLARDSNDKLFLGDHDIPGMQAESFAEMKLSRQAVDFACKFDFADAACKLQGQKTFTSSSLVVKAKFSFSLAFIEAQASACVLGAPFLTSRAGKGEADRCKLALRIEIVMAVASDDIWQAPSCPPLLSYIHIKKTCTGTQETNTINFSEVSPL